MKDTNRPWNKSNSGMKDFEDFLCYVNQYESDNPDVVEADKRNGCCIDIVQVYAMLTEAYEGRKPVEYIQEMISESYDLAS